MRSVRYIALVMLLAAPLCAQEAAKPASAQSELALRQGRIADKYARLEQLMLKMAEVDVATNPKRAALLKQAVQQSKDNLTRAQLESIVQLLDQQKLKRAVDGQSEAAAEMKALLQLLLSENRADRNRDKQDEIRKYIEEVERLLRLQKDVSGRTQAGEEAKDVAADQGKVADRTGNLSKKIQENEQAESPPGESPEPQKPEQNPGETPPADEQKPSDQPPDQQTPSEQPAKEGQPSDSQNDKQPMQGQPMQGQPMQGQPMPGGSQDQPMPAGEQPKQQNPARQRLEQAQQKMRAAQQKLEEAKRDDAKAAQDEARQELERAKAELEEILRQLREEEIERTLAQLEDRFRKMLEMQLKVNDSTQRLASIPLDARTREVDLQAGKLAVEQRKIALEADKAYQLLLEEGSSVAFPESVEEVRNDMETVAQRLAQTKLDTVTLGTEEDIVAALNELIAAMQQAQKDQEEKKQQQQQPQSMQGEPEDQPLVDKIAELKMLKAMQLRVNERTRRFSQMIAEPDDLTGQATDEDLTDAIEKLGERQSRLHRITRDIVLGKNQ